MRRLNYSWAITLANISLATLLTLPGRCQQSNSTVRNQPDGCSSIVDDRFKIATRYRAIGTIEDPGTHQHWILLRNLSRPAAPAALVQSPRNSSCSGFSPERSDLRFPSHSDGPSLPVIRAGDYLVVSEHTRFFDAELEASALKSAAIGESLTVRLKFGGRTLNAIATAPGRAISSDDLGEVRR
jgi:hypothetical protein